MAWIQRNLHQFKSGDLVLVNLSGRGDKDVDTVRARLAAAVTGMPA